MELLGQGVTDNAVLAQEFHRTQRVIRRKLKKIATATATHESAESASKLTGVDVSVVQKVLKNQRNRDMKKEIRLMQQPEGLSMLREIRDRLDTLIRVTTEGRGAHVPCQEDPEGK